MDGEDPTQTDIPIAPLQTDGNGGGEFRVGGRGGLQSRWEAAVDRGFWDASATTWGQGSSPVIAGDSVIVYHGPGEVLDTLVPDKTTGAKKWSVPLKEQQPEEQFDGFAGTKNGMIGTFSTPLVISASGRKEVVLPVVNKLRGFDLATGRELWSADGVNPLVYASPTVSGGTLVLYGGFWKRDVPATGGDGDVTGSVSSTSGG